MLTLKQKATTNFITTLLYCIYKYFFHFFVNENKTKRKYKEKSKV